MVSGRRVRTVTLRRGTYVRARMPGEKIRDLALDATIRAAAPYVRSRPAQNVRIRIEEQDLREKVRIGKVSTPTVFVVDASGSMFARERIESARGAVFSMMVDSYQKRDKVGLVAFQGSEGKEILPLCLSPDWGVQCLKDLVPGGSTPLCAGLEKGLAMLALEKLKNPEAIPVLVLISDGRANVPTKTGAGIYEELVNLTNQAWINKIHMIFIDVGRVETPGSPYGSSYKRILTERMSYYHVEQLAAGMIQDIVHREKEMLISSFA